MVTDVDIARWRLRSQHLVGSGPTSAEGVVRSLLGVQAENPAQSAWAVAARTAAPDPSDLGAALDEGRVVRVHVLRSTWHYVTAEDLVWLVELTAPGAGRPAAQQLAEVYDDAELDRLSGLVVDALAGRHLTRPQLAALLVEAGEQVPGHELMLLMAHLELRALVCSGPVVDGAHSYVLVADRVRAPRRLDRDEGLAELALRYATGHGPVTAEDLAYWASLSLPDARAGLTAAADGLATFEHDDRTFWHPPDQEPPTGPTEPAAHLLQILDETYRGYATASRWVLDAAGVVPRGRESAMGMALVDGQLVAAMKRSVTARQVVFELAPYASWHDDHLVPVERAAARYGAFLAREAVVDLR
ncbi:winged helix DNA-binding domain-containing protein [Nocardioides euryhalodurans]|uniref:winged helix DNA-binding domain-containing protein n=1 Tax=Nocardioides euryhalodurans TaxID=2518370 RepID=UPI0014211899|nr:winged helix DNA-binding domain-containing protein [Nocardioides euryhalodurans]